MNTTKIPKILVTGANGQLGRAFMNVREEFPGLELSFANKYDFDISVKSREASGLIKRNVDAVINCAAYTNVEKAESEPEEARLINATSVGYLAEACKEAGCLLVHYSTDYVFDGKKEAAYSELDQPNPLSVYGKTKWEGEQLLDEKHQRHFILRTSWLYSESGHNFFRTMIRLAKENGQLNVVTDQMSTPTYARSLARHTLMLMDKVLVKKEHVDYGLYHYSALGEASWWSFAEEIVNRCGLNVPVNKVTSEVYLTKAQRPAYSCLDSAKFVENTGIQMEAWQHGLDECILNHQISVKE